MSVNPTRPPRLPDRFLQWFCADEVLETLQGDLYELYDKRQAKSGKLLADVWYWADVASACRPFAFRNRKIRSNSNYTTMFQHYFKISWRSLLRNKGNSFINIGGLAVGMGVAILIGLWIHDELSYNKYHENYDRIAKLMSRGIWNGEIGTGHYMPFPMGPALAQNYESDFEHVVMSTFPDEHILSVGEVKYYQPGYYMSPGAPEMLSLKMLKGSRDGLTEMNSVLISESLSGILFGDENPMGKTLKIDNQREVKITGVYEDLPKNSQLSNAKFIAPWELFIASNTWLERFLGSWGDGMIQIFVLIAPNSEMAVVSEKIKNIIQDHESEEEKVHKKEAFLHPMSKWHLYEEFKNGENTGGQIQFVWLFGIVGSFVLFLACINFMNLSTARSEKRAREVGIRKAIGSVRSQLVGQFLSESLLVAGLSFIISLGIVILVLPWFNQIADKQTGILWTNPVFWFIGVGFTVATGAIAGSYPAFYLSSFQAVSVLKGTFRAGRLATVPRKVLVILQFSVSVVLIIGTIVVYQQIQHTQDREVGYDRERLIYLNMKSDDIHKHFEALRTDLLASGAVEEVAESSSAVTQRYNANFGGFDWKGKDPDLSDVFGITWVTPEYGRTVGWKFVEGKDFSREFSSDRSGFVVNETAVKYMGLENPVGETVRWDGKSFTILGVVKDMVVGSPYEPARPAIYMPLPWWGNVVTIRIGPARSTQTALETIESVFMEYAPGIPFDYKFASDQYARKFYNEVRIGRLASVFAALAIFISCLGLFGLASFVAEQRTKEIGIRKVLGASVVQLWQMLSKDFVVLVVISCLIAMPLGYYFMSSWLENYEYRTEIAWYIFAVTGLGAFVITLLTVSFHAIKAATANPVKSLRTE